jgi:hypothetical protein
MIPVYAFLVKHEKRTLASLPEPYQMPVSEFLASEVESA